MRCLRLLRYSFLIIAIQYAYCQDEHTTVHTLSLAPASARFEIVQSTLAAKWTFKLDKMTGVVSQLVKTKDDDPAWEVVPVVQLPQAPNTGVVRYQLFISGLASKFIFLINVDSGKTWQLQSFKDKTTGEESLVFVPFL